MFRSMSIKGFSKLYFHINMTIFFAVAWLPSAPGKLRSRVLATPRLRLVGLGTPRLPTASQWRSLRVAGSLRFP